MKHAREDYNRFQDPANDLLLARLLRMLSRYRQRVTGFIDTREECDAIDGAMRACEARQQLSAGSTPIAEDEPVMLFRAKDKLFVAVLENYRYLLSISGAQPDIIEAVERHIEIARQWQHKHGTKTPDLPKAQPTPSTAAIERAKAWIAAAPSNCHSISVVKKTGECGYATGEPLKQLPHYGVTLDFFAFDDPKALAAVMKWQAAMTGEVESDG